VRVYPERAEQRCLRVLQGQQRFAILRETVVMFDDPREYRQNAWRCAELAHTAKTPELKQTLLDLSKAWLKLAVEVDRGHVLLDKNPPSEKRPG
jgi:hypothetical protein